MVVPTAQVVKATVRLRKLRGCRDPLAAAALEKSLEMQSELAASEPIRVLGAGSRRAVSGVRRPLANLPRLLTLLLRRSPS